MELVDDTSPEPDHDHYSIREIEPPTRFATDLLHRNQGLAPSKYKRCVARHRFGNAIDSRHWIVGVLEWFAGETGDHPILISRSLLVRAGNGRRSACARSSTCPWRQARRD